MRSLSCGLLLAVVMSVGAGSVSAQEPPASKEQRARKLLVLMHSAEMGLQMVDAMIVTMKPVMPDAGDEFWTTFRQGIKGNDLVDMLVPVYVKNLDDADIDELLRFYSSPAGQHFIEKQPVILQESMAIGQKWGEQLAARAIEEMSKAKKHE